MKPLPAMLALVTDAFGGYGGIAQYNRDFFRALAGASVVSSIVILPRNAPDLIGPLPPEVEQEPARSGRTAFTIGSLRSALCRKTDIVFCGHLYIAPLAALIARVKNAKLIIQTHGIEAWPRPTRLQRFALEAADLVLCVSRHTRAAILTWAAIAPDRALVIPDTVREAFTPGDGSSLRAELGLQGKRVLLTVGRIDSRERYKGHDRVISAISDLVAKGHDICYLVVGEGDDRGRLEALAHEAGVSERVRFLGPVKRERLVEAYRMADLFVMPSTGEGFGIAFLEAMASGTPALGFDIGGARDALAGGELGAVTSEDQLSSALARLLSTPRCDPSTLAAAVRARFGRETFVTSAQAALRRLSEAG